MKDKKKAEEIAAERMQLRIILTNGHPVISIRVGRRGNERWGI